VSFATALTTVFPYRQLHAEAPPEEENLIRLSDIRKHDSEAERYWVYRRDRVYDITDWIPNHPGGEVILRSTGGDIEPYWNIFTIHQKQDVYDILEQYFIGKIDPRDLVDGKPPAEQVEDPFASDPEREARFVVRSARPFNAETPEDQLSSYITPTEFFFVRNHLWVPDEGIDSTPSLTVELADGTRKEYSVPDLRSILACKLLCAPRSPPAIRMHLTILKLRY